MSFATSLRRAVEAAPRVKLNEISTKIWNAWGAGALPDGEAEALDALVRARKADW